MNILPPLLKNIIRFFYLHMTKKGKVKFDFSSMISKESCFEGSNRVHSNTRFHGRMGYGSYIGQDCNVSAEVGRFTSIANNVRTNAGIHPYKKPYVTTSPMFYSQRKQTGSTFVDRDYYSEMNEYDSENHYAIKIGSDCWVGENSFIVGGVTIENGAVILANAVVTKSVPPFAIVGGVPAKIIGYRFEKNEIELIKKSAWWNKDIGWLKENSHIMRDFDLFQKEFQNLNA